MNELIRMDGASEFPVSGRELHERLGIGTEYAKWFGRMCEYGFEEGKDFKPFKIERVQNNQVFVKNDENSPLEDKKDFIPKLEESTGGRPSTDHQLTLSMAKELCMIQRTEQGREVRRYLIRVEEAWNSPDAIMARALTIANDRVKELTGQVLKLEASNSELTVQTQIMRPKAEYFDELVDRNLLTSFRETAKQLHVKERAFVDFLLSHKYVYRDKKGKLTPYAQHTEKGLFELKECVNEKTQWSGTQTLITPKGRETFRLLCQGL